LWFRPHQAAIQRSKIETMQAEQELVAGQRELNSARRKTLSDLAKYRRLLDYYHQTGLEQAAAIRRTATLQVQAGEIDFFQYLQSLQRYTETRLNYFDALKNYNRTVIQLEYLNE